MNPLELLEQEMAKWQSALHHLEQSRAALGETVYSERRTNLDKLINDYNFAIEILKQHGKDNRGPAVDPQTGRSQRETNS